MNKQTTQCPHCGAEFEIEQNWVGQQTACPACNQNFIIQVKPVPVPKKAVVKAIPVKTKTPDQKTVHPSPLKSNKLLRSILIIILCICAAAGLGYLIIYQVNEAARRKAEKIAEQQRMEKERKAKEEQQKAEAARKAKEAAEAARIAAEKQRREAEAARIAEMKKQMQGECEKAFQLKQTKKLFVLVPQEKNARVLLFRYDEKLDESIMRAIHCRSLLILCNQEMERAIAADQRNDLETAVKIFTRLKNTDLKSVMRMLSIQSEKIIDLAVRKVLLVKLKIVPENGQLREEIPPGEYIIVYLSNQSAGFSYIFQKSGERPLFLQADKGKWSNASNETK